MYWIKDLFEDWLDFVGNKEWHPHTTLVSVTLIDGRVHTGSVMCRRVPGRWEYRECTDDEGDELEFGWAFR